jgi:hypothetical protein
MRVRICGLRMKGEQAGRHVRTGGSMDRSVCTGFIGALLNRELCRHRQPEPHTHGKLARLCQGLDAASTIICQEHHGASHAWFSIRSSLPFLPNAL